MSQNTACGLTALAKMYLSLQTAIGQIFYPNILENNTCLILMLRSGIVTIINLILVLFYFGLHCFLPLELVHRRDTEEF